MNKNPFILLLVIMIISWIPLTFLGNGTYPMWPIFIETFFALSFSWTAYRASKANHELIAIFLQICGLALPIVVFIRGCVVVYHVAAMITSDAATKGLYGCAWIMYGAFGIVSVVASEFEERKH